MDTLVMKLCFCVKMNNRPWTLSRKSDLSKKTLQYGPIFFPLGIESTWCKLCYKYSKSKRKKKQTLNLQKLGTIYKTNINKKIYIETLKSFESIKNVNLVKPVEQCQSSVFPTGENKLGILVWLGLEGGRVAVRRCLGECLLGGLQLAGFTRPRQLARVVLGLRWVATANQFSIVTVVQEDQQREARRVWWSWKSLRPWSCRLNVLSEDE